MNKLLIKCYGSEIVLDTIRTVSDLVQILELNLKNPFLLINNFTLDDEGFKEEIVINPRFVTLVKDITPSNYWTNKIVLEKNVYGWPVYALAKEIKDNKIVFFDDEEIEVKDLRIKSIEHSQIILTKKDVNIECHLDGKVVAKPLSNDKGIQDFANKITHEIMNAIKKQQLSSGGIINV